MTNGRKDGVERARRRLTHIASIARLASAGSAHAVRSCFRHSGRIAHHARRRLAGVATATAAVRMSLATRVLLVLVSIAAASTTIAGLLQDNSLTDDLQRAAKARLENAAAMVGQLADEYLLAQVERCRAISSTPQFLANVEARHIPTLLHFASELATTHGAAAVLFLDAGQNVLAGVGDEGLRRRLLKHLDESSASQPQRARGAATVCTFLGYSGGVYSAAGVPLRDDGRTLGSLVALTALGERQLGAWSGLCRNRVWIGPDGSDPSLLVRAIDDLELRVCISVDAEHEALANSRWNLLTGGLAGLALASAVSIFLARSLVRPICAIGVATERIRAGDLGFRLDDQRTDEVGDVARAFNLMLDSLRHNIDHRVRAENQVSHQSRHDSLTGLGNRRSLKDRLASTLDASRVRESRVGVIFLDVDRFKDVNDTLGHTAGDELLVEVAKRLRTCVATGAVGADGEDQVFVARMGGDEFTIVLCDIKDRQEIEAVADRILAALAVPYSLRGRELVLTASLGIAVWPDDADDVEALLCESDMAMHQAKDHGGGGYEFYSDSMQEVVARRLALDNGLRHALENNEFELFYQPKVDLGTNQITGMEALLRWRHPSYGMIGPDEFIPRLEETGAIVPIGAWVLRTAMQQAVEWQCDRSAPVGIAVNVSVRQIEAGDDFVNEVTAILGSTGLDPRLLDLEITEGVLLEDPEAAIVVLEKLRQLGIGLSLDDFGTGYSSLSQLRQLPFDTLKLDRSFICGADSDPDAAALVGSIIAMAKVVELRVVVEGVETRKQRRLLEQLGCDEIQGYLISKPMPAEAATAMLRSKRRRRLRPEQLAAHLARSLR